MKKWDIFGIADEGQSKDIEKIKNLWEARMVDNG